jgi:hypothetical protein
MAGLLALAGAAYRARIRDRLEVRKTTAPGRPSGTSPVTNH